GIGNLMEMTIHRANAMTDVDQLVIVTRDNLSGLTRDAVTKAGCRIPVTYIFEPEGRDTALAIALAATHIGAQGGNETALIVMPSDHLLTGESTFSNAVSQAKPL